LIASILTRTHELYAVEQVYGWNLALSLVAGNSTIWKPAQSTPLCAIATTKIIASVLEANSLPGALSSLLCGGGEPGATLVSDKRIDLLSFTGSESRGRQVGMTVAGRFGKSLLELGGNNAAVVLPDANLPLALRTILFSALGTAGQRCTSTRRLFIHSSIAEEFLKKLVVAYRSASMRIGDPMNPETLIGPLHAKDGVSRFQTAIKEIEAQGGQILIGGNKFQFTEGKDAGVRFYPPPSFLERYSRLKIWRGN
jgi:aldehyde dehydrogenase family 7 protein A1